MCHASSVQKAKEKGLVRAGDLRAVTDAALSLLRARLVHRRDDDIAGWHNTFEPGRIGTTGSALPLALLREQHAIAAATDRAVVQGLLAAQSTDGEAAGGWCILSVASCPTVEGTAPTLAVIARSSGVDVATAVQAGRRWLLRNQRADGGWGSTASDTPRTCLTSSALSTLASLDVPDRDALRGGMEWLKTHQSSDGSWPEIPGQSGTVVHTALAIRALLACGVPLSDACVVTGLAYIEKNWRAGESDEAHESYDATTGTGTYSRVALVHDVDAEVVLTLIEADPNGLRAPLWQAAAGWVEANRTGSWCEAIEPRPTLWTIVPRATAAARLADQLPAAHSVVVYRPHAVALASHGLRRAAFALFILAFRSIPVAWRIVAGALAGIVLIAGIVLVASDIWDAGDFWAAIPIPVAITLTVALATRSNDRP